MRKCLSVGILFISLMVFWATIAAAGATWILYQGIWIKIGSLEVTSDWYVKNLDVRPATYAVTINPISATVHFANPGNNLGGDQSANFGNNVEVTLTGTITPTLAGKGKIQDTLKFGDCDNCDPAIVNLPQDGALWLLFVDATDESGNLCSSYPVSAEDPEPGYFARIDCIKKWLTRTYEPNTKWPPVSMLLYKFDLVFRAWQDVDKDGVQEETVYGQYFNFTLSNDGVNYTSTDPNNCVWQYSYPKSQTDECSNLANQCCDPDWGIYFELF